jgi:hypothetical protein
MRTPCLVFKYLLLFYEFIWEKCLDIFIYLRDKSLCCRNRLSTWLYPSELASMPDLEVIPSVLRGQAGRVNGEVSDRKWWGLWKTVDVSL